MTKDTGQKSFARELKDILKQNLKEEYECSNQNYQKLYELICNLEVKFSNDLAKANQAVNQLELDKKAQTDKSNEQVKQLEVFKKNINEHLQELQSLRIELKETKDSLDKLQEEFDEHKKGVILNGDNANRSGRPPLTDKEIDLIRELLRQGYSQRKVAEITGTSNGSVNKYAKDVKLANHRPEQTKVQELSNHNQREYGFESIAKECGLSVTDIKRLADIVDMYGEQKALDKNLEHLHFDLNPITEKPKYEKALVLLKRLKA
jgi:transcriptional regulator with XRE-family HTH domain